MTGLYFAADTLGIKLTAHGSSLLGETVRPIQLGPWPAELEVYAESDILNPIFTAFFIRFTHNLWAYLTLSDESGESLLYVVDGPKAGLGEPKMPDYTGISIDTTVANLRARKAVTATFTYDKKWTRVHADHLEQDTPH